MSSMLDQFRTAPGFVAALDQSGGSTPKALEAYGVSRGSWANEAEMFDLVHVMRTRILIAPPFTSGKVIAAILFEQTVTAEVAGAPTSAFLIRHGICPFLKVDVGLEAQSDGVQLMKPISLLEKSLDLATSHGMLGTKMRSVVNSASVSGIKAIVAQQFEIASRIGARGLLPILEPEVLLTTPDRATAERILAAEILTRLDGLGAESQVVLKLTIPEEATTYDPLAAHPRVARLLALSGGYTRDQACAALSRTDAMIASFSRALVQDLRHDMDAPAFDAALQQAISQIYGASVEKHAPEAY